MIKFFNTIITLSTMGCARWSPNTTCVTIFNRYCSFFFSPVWIWVCYSVKMFVVLLLSCYLHYLHFVSFLFHFFLFFLFIHVCIFFIHVCFFFFLIPSLFSSLFFPLFTLLFFRVQDDL